MTKGKLLKTTLNSKQSIYQRVQVTTNIKVGLCLAAAMLSPRCRHVVPRCASLCLTAATLQPRSVKTRHALAGWSYYQPNYY